MRAVRRFLLALLPAKGLTIERPTITFDRGGAPVDSDGAWVQGVKPVHNFGEGPYYGCLDCGSWEDDTCEADFWRLLDDPEYLAERKASAAQIIGSD